MKTGFVGLGNMGLPMAERIVRAGHQLAVWARRPEVAEGLVAEGAVSLASPREVALASEVVCLCVRTDDDVVTVAMDEKSGVLGGMKPDSVLMIHATVLPATIERLERAARARGVHLIDAPVSGGASGAQAGTLTVILGGDRAAIDRVRPVLDAFASNQPHVGPPGAAQLLKLVNNNLCYANVAMSVAALELLDAFGVDTGMAAGVLTSSSGASHGLGLVLNAASVAKMTGPTSNVCKDVAHLVALTAEKGLESALTGVSSMAADSIARYARAGAGATKPPNTRIGDTHG